MGGGSETWNEARVKPRVPENLEHKLIKEAALGLTQPSYLYNLSWCCLLKQPSGSWLMNVFVSILHVGRLLFDLGCYGLLEFTLNVYYTQNNRTIGICSIKKYKDITHTYHKTIQCHPLNVCLLSYQKNQHLPTYDSSSHANIKQGLSKSLLLV